MTSIEWLEGNRIKVNPPKNCKKITGTRLAAIFGLNAWSTPFEVWCAITRTYEKPFEDTVYTIAGKTIEPKQAAYMREQYFWTKLLTPSEAFGEDYFEKTRGDFYPERAIFGGMWDYQFVSKDGKPATILEMKTTKRAEDWAEDIPEYYAMQAALYAYLSGVDEVIMVCSFLEEKDYAEPDKFECTSKNTITCRFLMSERYPDFEDKYIKQAGQWWREHVETGISPAFDEKKDAEILQVLRTNSLSPETDIAGLIAEAESLKARLDAHAAEIADEEKRYKTVTDLIKQAAVLQFREGDKKVSLAGTAYTWEVTRSQTTQIDKDAMKKDGIYEKYTTTTDSYKLQPKKKKEG